MAFLYKVGVLTISDRCSQGQAVDKSGPKLVEIVTNNLGWVVTQQSIVPDEIEEIKGGFQLEFVSISLVINHMTCYKLSALIGLNYSIQTGEKIF